MSPLSLARPVPGGCSWCHMVLSTNASLQATIRTKYVECLFDQQRPCCWMCADWLLTFFFLFVCMCECFSKPALQQVAMLCYVFFFIIIIIDYKSKQWKGVRDNNLCLDLNPIHFEIKGIICSFIHSLYSVNFSKIWITFDWSIFSPLSNQRKDVCIHRVTHTCGAGQAILIYILFYRVCSCLR